MKSRRPARRSRPVWGRVAGYGGTVLLVAAAVVVLLMPLLDDGTGDTGERDAAGAAASPTAGQEVPGGPVRPEPPAGQPPGRDPNGAPQPGGGSGGQDGQGGQGGSGGGPPIPTRNAPRGLDWCPQGTARYSAAPTGVAVAVAVAAGGAVQAELDLGGGRAPLSQQATVRGGSPHTFHFRGVAPGQVQRVKVTTLSIGGAMQSCYARAA